ncbi:alpha/beta hydrolase [Piscinibacter sp.]|uniref:alpha/beta hydrolase n=1 Tax=Piscinibacter sp. TaxID=1903157 RepID=UPI0039E5C58D
MKSVTFKNRTWDVAAELRLPPGFDETQRYAAIVCVHPGSSCKGQTAGLYAAQLAEQGFVTIAFDASFQGESGGEPRYLEDPATRVEDVRCAVDYLVTLPFVDDERIGVLGVCAGGGYAVNAALTEKRIKAVGSVVGANIGALNRAGDAIATLEAIGKQRTAEARGAEPMITPWIPNSTQERDAAGITEANVDVFQAVEYYRTPRGQNACAPNRLRFTSMGSVIAFDAFHLVEELLNQPIQIITGSVPGVFGSKKDGQELYRRVKGEKDLFVVEGATHYDLYDQPEPVAKAVAKLVPFYRKHLGA